MTLDLIVRGATVVAAGGPERLDIGVADGKIAELAPELSDARDEIDATGLHVLPGVVDAHVHFNEPGRTDWEGWATGTRALAAGGATVGVEMPLNAHPPTTSAAAFDAKRAAADASAHVDYALWGGIVPGNLGELEALAERGVVGFKAFMSASGVDDFERADDLTLYEGMRKAAILGLAVAVHAESEAITSGLAARARAEGRGGVRDYLDSRPAVAELEAIAIAIALAEDAGASLHIVHVSTGRGVALVAEARARGVDVSCETCPHYLVLTDEDAERIGVLAKCAPPLRPATESEALWDALRDGTLPMVASDHSPSPPELKDGDAFTAWGGISGCQSLLPLLLTEDRLPLENVGRVASGFPAERLRLRGKGRIAPGADADLALVDLTAHDVLRSEDLFYRHPHSPFVGRTVRARVVRTLVRGRTVFCDGRIVAPPSGRLVTPEPQRQPA
jgi:allantoinase